MMDIPQVYFYYQKDDDDAFQDEDESGDEAFQDEKRSFMLLFFQYQLISTVRVASKGQFCEAPFSVSFTGRMFLSVTRTQKNILQRAFQFSKNGVGVGRGEGGWKRDTKVTKQTKKFFLCLFICFLINFTIDLKVI